MAKTLVTGGTGFIGFHVADLFLAQGFEVVILDDLSKGSGSNINQQEKFYQMDIRKTFETEKLDFVSHHVAQMDMRCSVIQSLFDVYGNVNRLECVREQAT